jgi:hypothetical protein
MALTATLTLTDNFGVDVTLTDLYVRVDRVDGNKEGILATTGLYKGNGTELVSTSTYLFKPSVKDGAVNFIAQSYQHLKTLPEFANAVDC